MLLHLVGCVVSNHDRVRKEEVPDDADERPEDEQDHGCDDVAMADGRAHEERVAAHAAPLHRVDQAGENRATIASHEIVEHVRSTVPHELSRIVTLSQVLHAPDDSIDGKPPELCADLCELGESTIGRPCVETPFAQTIEN